MFGVFAGSVFMGHLYICLLVAAIEGLLFRELVRVRYSAYFHTIQNTIPLFRTTQWMWFAVAIFYTYGDFVLEIIQRNPQLHYLLPYAQYAPSVAFTLYSGTFVVTIFNLQREHIKFQLNQSCWTVLVLMLTVGQLKYVCMCTALLFCCCIDIHPIESIVLSLTLLLASNPFQSIHTILLVFRLCTISLMA
jgi:phosphatidate cytidylyltransferase